MTTTPERRSDADPSDLLDPDVVRVLRHAFAGVAETPASGARTGPPHLDTVAGTARPARSRRRRRVTTLLAAAGTGAVAAGVAGALALAGNVLTPGPTATAVAAGTPTAETFAPACEKRLAEGSGPKTLPKAISHLLLADTKALVAYAGDNHPGVVCVLRKKGEQWNALRVYVNPTAGALMKEQEEQDKLDKQGKGDERAGLDTQDEDRVDADGLMFYQFSGQIPASADAMTLETDAGLTAPITMKDGKYLTLLLLEPGKTLGKMWWVTAYSNGVRIQEKKLGGIGTAEVTPDGVQLPIEGADNVPEEDEDAEEPLGPDKEPVESP